MPVPFSKLCTLPQWEGGETLDYVTSATRAKMPALRGCCRGDEEGDCQTGWEGGHLDGCETTPSSSLTPASAHMGLQDIM